MTDQRQVPWYQRVRRWGQTNLTEIDPLYYDVAFWAEHWRRTRVQGVIVNAGGIVAYYPTGFELQYRAQHLGDRDLFGAVVSAAREASLTVLARMDSNRALESFYAAHPDWFACDRDGKAYRAQDRYLACINSPYYHEYLPKVLIEIIDRYQPDGFTDNSWSGLGRNQICYCPHCAEKFRTATSMELPREHDWDAPAYRRWIQWSYDCRVEIWDLNNAVTKKHGGENCIWLGMLNGEPVGQSWCFRDLYRLGQRSQAIMCDHQSRDQAGGFERNGLNGKLLHGVLGWDKLIPESMAMYVRGQRPFRVCANPAEESRMWMIEGFAGGISPWWHHIGARHEDRRQYDTAEPAMRWHEANEEYLYDREPVAAAGVLWSHQNLDFFGREGNDERTTLPMRGWTAAMTRARIPYLPIHAEQIDQYAEKLAVLILPNLGAISEAQCQALRRFVGRGGSLIATGQSSLYTEWGDRRADFALTDLLGVGVAGEAKQVPDKSTHSWELFDSHTYLRLTPELNQPGIAGDMTAARHPILRGFDKTDLIPFGGTLQHVRADDGSQVLATFVPPFPIYPPEFCWMRTPRTDVPALILREHACGGRVAYLPADIDRCYGRSLLPDHGNLLANIIRWAARDSLPLRVTGPGYIDCHLYRQGERLILHLVNLTHCRAWPAYVEEHVPVSPLSVAIRTGPAGKIDHAKLLVSGTRVPARVDDGWVHVEGLSVADHEVLVIG